MGGVDELPSPSIPTVLIEESVGKTLLRNLGSHIVVSKADLDGIDLKKPITTSVAFQCSNDWQERKEHCQEGDDIDVKVVSGEAADGVTQFPQIAIRLFRATIIEIYQDNASVHVHWQPQFVNEDVSALPTEVPLNTTFHNGVPCNSVRGARITQIAEPMACEAAFVVHAPSLCAHLKLAPPPPREPQVISCVADKTSSLFASDNQLQGSSLTDTSDEDDGSADLADDSTHMSSQIGA